MLPERAPTLRDVAQVAKCSTATVSEALRGSPRVLPATARRVRQAAKQLGYRMNPLVSTIMGEVRRAHVATYRGLIAAIDWAVQGITSPSRYHRAIFAGVQERAEELGFHAELFWTGQGQPTLQALDRIFAARNVAGVVVMPFRDRRDFSHLRWSRFAAVSMDYCLNRPVLHRVCPDHHLGIMEALERIYALGYQRPGMIIERYKDERILRKWSAGFEAFTADLDAANRLPVHIVDEVRPREFLCWVKTERPDVVVGHSRMLVDWLRVGGFAVPEQIGFFSLNASEQAGPCAGLDLRPRLFGRAALEAVVAQIGRYETGVPEYPKTVLVNPGWRDGPTLRKHAPTV